MKSIFKVSIIFLVFCNGCYHKNEELEFIQLEKKLADKAASNDEENFYNFYAIFSESDRLAIYTDSLIAISKLYDSLILAKEQTNYDSELQIVLNAIHRIEKQTENYFGNKHVDNDSIFYAGSNLALDFKRYSTRIKLSRILKFFHHKFSFCASYYFDTQELHPFITYKKSGNLVEGKFSLGYILKDSQAKIDLTKNGKKCKPISYTESNIQTEAYYQLKDTGTYTLRGFHERPDPIMGNMLYTEDKKYINVKPKKD